MTQPNIDVFVVTTDIRKHTGFAVNGRNVCYGLAADFDVANLSEHAFTREKVDVRGRDVWILPTVEGRQSDQYADFDFGKLVDEYNPDVVVSLMNMRMVAHIPEHRLPRTASLILRELGTDGYEFDNIVRRTRETIRQLPDDPRFKWVAQLPIDGDPLPDYYADRLGEVSSVVAMSDYGAATLRDEFGDDAVDLTIPHAVDVPDRIADTTGWFPDGAFVVGSVNANDYRKQHSRLLEAWGRFYEMANEPDDVVFYLHTGRSDSSGFDVNAYAEKYGIDRALYPYQGPQDRGTLFGLYHDFDVFASATAGEGFGMTAVEAMWAGTPVVITDYTTSEELVVKGSPSPRGRLVKPVDMYDDPHESTSVERALVSTEEMARYLLRYYQKDSERERDGRNAREWARANFGYDDVAGAWAAHVNDVVER